MTAEEWPLVPVHARPVWALAIKRALDVIGAGAVLIVLSPLLAAIALVILVTGGRPVLYRWNIVVEGGRPGRSYKFRTMVQNADVLREHLQANNEMTGAVFKMRDDPRVTRVGRALRRTSLDELPQLWSVLTGELSLVGPRPPLQTEYVRFTPYQRTKLAVKPGLTCLWQVSGRNRINDLDEWVRLDREYIERWSLWLDIQILLKTIPAVLSGRGAS